MNIIQQICIVVVKNISWRAHYNAHPFFIFRGVRKYWWESIEHSIETSNHFISLFVEFMEKYLSEIFTAWCLDTRQQYNKDSISSLRLALNRDCSSK
jgi:hypothetical protein